MYINNIIALDEIIEKNEREHQVFQDEVEEVFYNRPKFRKGQKGKYVRGRFVLRLWPNRRRPLFICRFYLQKDPGRIDHQRSRYG